MIYIGVDPGANGGIGIIDTTAETEEAYVYTDEVFINALHRPGRMRVMVEEVHSMPKQGVRSTFTFGVNYGTILGILKALRTSYETVSPQVWKKEFRCSSDKKTSIETCRALFPLVDLRKNEHCRKDHDGKAEALLLAEYCRRETK